MPIGVYRLINALQKASLLPCRFPATFSFELNSAGGLKRLAVTVGSSATVATGEALLNLLIIQAKRCLALLN